MTMQIDYEKSVSKLQIQVPVLLFFLKKNNTKQREREA